MLERELIYSYVNEKFKNSEYIKGRGLDGEQQYFKEEVKYWTEKIYNSNWKKSLFEAEFDNIYKIDRAKSLHVQQPYNDYIGQTFKIDATECPNGLFMQAISVYTAQEDLNATITLDIRKLINGIPENIPIPFSIVTLKPDEDYREDVTKFVAWDTTPYNPTWTNLNTRHFEFDFPVYLKPGYYCFTLNTNSKNYSVYVTENGKGTIGTNKTIVNPYIGDFIYSGQGESWVIDPTRDLCFILYKKVYSVGTKTVNLNLRPSTFNYDGFHVKSNVFEIPEKAYISDLNLIVSEFGTENKTTIPIQFNQNLLAPSYSTANSVILSIELTNTDKNITPLIDVNETGIALYKNIIDPYSTIISDSELTAKDGTAFAKYTSKHVLLNEGFDADGITVYVDVNSQYGSSIEVFYRILNKYDQQVFEDSPWYRLPKKSTNLVTQLSGNYSEETYELLNLSYISDNGEVYDSFNQMAIKVVFYAEDSTKVPTIKNLRVIATV
jgi:hypothetical protein